MRVVYPSRAKGKEGSRGDSQKFQGRDTTHSSQSLVAAPKLRLVVLVGATSHQDLGSPVDPALRSSLSEVDFLTLVSPGERIEKNAFRNGLSALPTIFPLRFFASAQRHPANNFFSERRERDELF